MMNFILMRLGFPPIIIPVEFEATYFELLNIADHSGDIRPFYRFIANCSIRTMDKVFYLTIVNKLFVKDDLARKLGKNCLHENLWNILVIDSFSMKFSVFKIMLIKIIRSILKVKCDS